MIGKRLDDATVCDCTTRTGSNHPFQLALKLTQLIDACMGRFEMSPRDMICMVARSFGVIRQLYQRANVGQLEAEQARMANEDEPPHVCIGITPASTLRAQRRGQQPLLFIEADRGDLDPRDL